MLLLPACSSYHLPSSQPATPADGLVSRRWALGLLAGAPLATQLQRPALADVGPSIGDPVCDPAVSCVRSAKGQDIWLVGTAHISEDSAELVRRVLRQVKPDEVMIELDASRAARMLGTRPASLKLAAPPGVELDRASMTPQAASPFGMGAVAGRVLRGDLQEAKAQAVGVGLSSMYKQLDEMGFQSGNEFVVAVQEADALGATLLLGDRDARETLRRLRDALGEVISGRVAPSGAPVPQALLDATQGSAELTKDNVQATMSVLKQRENVRALSAYLRSEVPPLYTALIAERDAYMAASLLGADGQKIVAVVGLAHVDGIEAAILNQPGARGATPKACAAAARVV